MMHVKKCDECSSEMKPRGASDASGSLSFKCKNTQCGRTSWVRRVLLKPPVPLTVRKTKVFKWK